MKLTFKTKIIGICIFWSLLFLSCGAVIYISQEKQNAVLKELEHSKQVVHGFNRLLTITINLETGIRGYLLSSDDWYLEPFNQNEAKFDEEARQLEASIAQLPQQKDHLKIISELKSQWIQGPAVEEMMARKKLTRNLITTEEFHDIFKKSKGKELTDKIRSEVEAALVVEAERVATLSQQQYEASEMVHKSILYGFPLSISIGLAFMIYVISLVNLTILRLVNSLFNTSLEMETSSQTLMACGVELGKACELTSSATQETASVIEQIGSMTSSNTATAQDSLNVAANCLTSSKEGQQVGEAIRTSMSEIDRCGEEMVERVTANTKRLASIIAMIDEIKSKTQIINQIVFQTKLLSFNASVEAARAGEHGKGFSVVAQEIGALAKISGDASKEIDILLASSSSEVENIVNETTQSLADATKEIQQRIELGSEKTSQCHEKINEIGSQVSVVKDAMSGIVEASKEQAAGVKAISKAIQRIEQSAENQTVIFYKYTDTANRLKTYSETMDQGVVELRALFGVKQEKTSARKSDQKPNSSGEEAA